MGRSNGVTRKPARRQRVLTRTQPKPSAVLNTLWEFACERQRVFEKRSAGHPGPWTADPIIREYRFTNVFRASDRVSQYLIRRVIYGEEPANPSDLLFRILLFKLFNKIETWELLEQALGRLSSETFSFSRFDRVLSRAQTGGTRLYSAAYIMPSTGVLGERSKYRGHLRLLELVLKSHLADRITRARSLADVYALLLELPTIGPFLAFQFAIDINYSELIDFNEMDFVVAGPGALDGLAKCFVDTADRAPADLIRWVNDTQDDFCDRVGERPPTLAGRRLQLIDVQNLFCEVSKYARVAHPDVQGTSSRTKIKQRFRASARPEPLFLPPKWGLACAEVPTRVATKQREALLV